MRSGPVELAVKRDLQRLPVADRRTTLAASALALARLLDDPADEVSPDKRLAAAAQAARELRATVGELLKSAPPARSGIDQLRARRAARAADG